MLHISRYALLLGMILAVTGCTTTDTSDLKTYVAMQPGDAYTPDQPSPPSPPINNDENATIQQMNDTNAQNNSMESAEQQNEINSMPIDHSNQW